MRHSFFLIPGRPPIGSDPRAPNSRHVAGLPFQISNLLRIDALASGMPPAAQKIATAEHVNRRRGQPHFCPFIQVSVAVPETAVQVQVATNSNAGMVRMCSCWLNPRTVHQVALSRSACEVRVWNTPLTGSFGLAGTAGDGDRTQQTSRRRQSGGRKQ